MQPHAPYGPPQSAVPYHAGSMQYGTGGYGAPAAPVHATCFALGDEVVLLRGAAMPHHCVKCAQPSSKHIQTTMHWHPTWVGLTILLSPLIYILVASLVRKSQPISVPLCDQHAERRRKAGLLAVGVFLLSGLSFALLASGAMRGVEMALLLLCVACPVAALVVWLVGGSLLRPVFIDDRIVRMKGAAPGFLRGLPPWMWG